MKSLSLLFADVFGTAALFAIPLVSAAPAWSGAFTVSQEERLKMARNCETFQDAKVGELVAASSQKRGLPINVRDNATTKSRARHIGYSGDIVGVLERKISEGGYCWYRVEFNSSGATGWVRGDLFSPYFSH